MTTTNTTTSTATETRSLIADARKSAAVARLIVSRSSVPPSALAVDALSVHAYVAQAKRIARTRSSMTVSATEVARSIHGDDAYAYRATVARALDASVHLVRTTARGECASYQLQEFHGAAE